MYPESLKPTPRFVWGLCLWRQLCYLAPLKAGGTAAFMYGFFTLYFYLLDHPRTSPTVIPRIFIDDWIVYSWLAFPIYASLWVYISLVPALIGNFKTLLRYTFWILSMCATGLFIFWLWPSQAPDWGLDWRHYPGLALLKGVDTSGNVFPSLHVAAALFTAFWLQHVLRQCHCPALFNGCNWLLCLTIFWSTMATYQHVALDVLSGIVLGLLFVWPSLRHAPNTLRLAPS